MLYKLRADLNMAFLHTPHLSLDCSSHALLALFLLSLARSLALVSRVSLAFGAPSQACLSLADRRELRRITMHERWRYRHVVPPSQPLVLLALVVVLVACVVSSVGAQGNSPAVFALRENPNAAAASTQQYSALLEEQQRADDAAPLSFEEEELASQPEYTRLRSLRERVVQVMEELQSATSEYQSSLSRATTLAHAISRHVIEPAFRSLASDAARPDGSVVILVVNSGFLEVALNCICSMRMVASDPTRDRFLVVATDRSTFNILRAMRVPTYFFQSGVAGTSFPFDSPLSTAYQRFGSYDLQRLVHARMQVSLWLLQLGYSVLVCDADLVWLRDPFPLIHLANATTPHKVALSLSLAPDW